MSGNRLVRESHFHDITFDYDLFMHTFLITFTNVNRSDFIIMMLCCYLYRKSFWLSYKFYKKNSL